MPKRLALLLSCLATQFGCLTAGVAEESPAVPCRIPVVVASYFPVKGDRIDIEVTGDWDSTLAATREKTKRQTRELIEALENGSRYHGYKDADAKPSLDYEVVHEVEYLEPLPTVAHSGPGAPMTNYDAIMGRIDIRKWVLDEGVKEIWIWAYHGGKVGLWESNMAGPFRDLSNSNRHPNDLPKLPKTYTVYHYNYQRGTSEATENHMHQLEAVLNHVDGRDRTPPERWSELLFWGKFVGSDRTHKIVRPGCGWAHYPPNAERDYDWANPRYVETDIEDWQPDGSGRKQHLNCLRWNGDSLQWFVYWMQNLPGADSGLTYQGKKLTNWWWFLGDLDSCLRNRIGLVEE